MYFLLIIFNIQILCILFSDIKLCFKLYSGGCNIQYLTTEKKGITGKWLKLGLIRGNVVCSVRRSFRDDSLPGFGFSNPKTLQIHCFILFAINPVYITLKLPWLWPSNFKWPKNFKYTWLWTGKKYTKVVASIWRHLLWREAREMVSYTPCLWLL